LPFALIDIAANSVVKILAEIPDTLKLPDNDLVVGIPKDWKNWQSDSYAMRWFDPFMAPAGKVAIGNPSYTVAADGSVSETYDVIDAPPPKPPVVTSLQFRHLFTPTEAVAITTAGQSDVQIRVFMDEASAAGTVDLGVDEVKQGVAYLVAKNIITQDRAGQILKGVSP